MKTDTRISNGGGKRDAYHHGDLRAALVAAARRIVEESGTEEVSLRAVARAVGVSPGAPYHHFRNKPDLLAAVAADGFRDFVTRMTERSESAADPRDRLDRLGVAYVAFALDHPALFRLMQGAEFQGVDVPPELVDAQLAAYEPLVRAVGSLLPGASPARLSSACVAAWSLIHGVAVLANDGRLGSLLDLGDLDRAVRSVTAQLEVAQATG